MEKNKVAKKTYTALQKYKKKLKIRALILALFLLVVNAYAWFVFAARADLSVEGNVIGWDIKFYSDGSEEMNSEIIIDDLYPGMEPFERKIVVENSSDIVSDFSYQINAVTIFGQEYSVDNQEDIFTTLANDYPFHLTFEVDKTDLTFDGDTLTFMVKADWPFEAEEAYYPLTKEFVYSDQYVYYVLVDGTYVVDDTVNSDNFLEKVATGLYVESDDGDSFWGEYANVYQEEHPDLPAISIALELAVEQRSED